MQLAAQIKGDFTKGQLTIWEEVEKYGIPLNRITPDGSPWKIRTAAIDSAWQLGWVLDNFFVPRFPYWAAEDLLKAQQEGTDKKKTKLRLTPEALCYKFPTGLSLYTEQDPAFRRVMELWFPTDGSKPVDHVLIPGGTGAGKTIIAAACVYEAVVKHNFHLPPDGFEWLPLLYPVQWFTVPNAKEQTIRECERVGLSDYMGKYIHVFGYSEVSSSSGVGRLTKEEFITPEEDPFADEDDKNEAEVIRIIKWLDTSCPRVLVVDECHKLANPESGISRTFATLRQALDRMPWLNCKTLWLSATPFEKVSDSKSFVTFAEVVYGGTRITPKNFGTMFAKDIAKGSPTVVTAASMERLFLAIKSHVVELPYYPWPCKSINSVKIVDFECEKDRNYVDSAWDRHIERCQKLGKDSPTGMGAVYASYTIFRNDIEHVRIPQTVRMMVEDVKNGRSAVCGTAFTGAVIKGVFSLIDEYGVDPDRISVIWGGRANIRPEKILAPYEMFEVIQEALKSGEGLNKETKRLIKRNLAWQQDALLFGDENDADKQNNRYRRLQKLGLIGIQTKQKRQAEIDKMQSGKADYCFFTMASGGTGLSLPHCDSRQRPRSGYFTPIYSGKEFTQAFGRLPRRNSISDSYQCVVLLNGTIESEHVAPILDLKLRAASSFTSKKTDLISHISELFMERKEEFEAKREFGAGVVRTLEQAHKDALEDEGTQVHFSDGTDDEDNDDDDDTTE